jgi:hypothetical protein
LRIVVLATRQIRSTGQQQLEVGEVILADFLCAYCSVLAVAFANERSPSRVSCASRSMAMVSAE